MNEYGRPIPEMSGVTRDVFDNEILPAGSPVVFRGLVSDWPIVKAGRASPQAACEYLRRISTASSVHAMYGPPSIGGRFFYNDDLSGFNFRESDSKLTDALDLLLGNLDAEPPAAMAVQSVRMRLIAPGFEAAHAMPLLGNVEPRLWVGSAGIVAAHHDPSDNIACAAAGRRRFTLFPPDQVGNLYLGPMELTPAGTTISLVDLFNPDFEQFPKFRDALEASLYAELEPGDAVFVPYLWWHNVRSLERFNVLINYWWEPASGGRNQPRDAMYHAMMAIAALSPAQRAAWRAMFDNYVFKTNGEPGAHIPAERRGMLGAMDSKAISGLRNALARGLMRSSNK